jgi:hypothetical protein
MAAALDPLPIPPKKSVARNWDVFSDTLTCYGVTVLWWLSTT